MAETQRPHEPETKVRDFYRHALALLDRAGVPYAVGGGYAMAWYTQIVRHTKDLDVFIEERNRDAILDLFLRAGYRTELTWPHFLVKALHEDAFVDILYNASNGLCPVDPLFFEKAVSAHVLGRATPLCPAEEIIWTKAFVMGRDRFDGADVLHLIRARAEQIDWRRLRERFRGHERVLLAHLVLFDYVYPSERGRVPGWVSDELTAAARDEPPGHEKICRGTFLSGDQYASDVYQWGYADARLRPLGPLTREQIATISPSPPPNDNGE